MRLFLILLFTLTTTAPVMAKNIPIHPNDIWAIIDTEWGHIIRQENIPVNIQEMDVTCDGQMDVIASRIDIDSPDGPFFRFILLTHHNNIKHAEAHTLPFTGSYEQYGLCMNPDNGPKAELYFEPWPEADIKEFIGMNVCHTPIEIVDNMCDTPAFFWAHDEPETKDQSHLVFFRH